MTTFLFSCKKYDEDEFYNYIEDFHSLYVPILKPYKIDWGHGYEPYINMEELGQINHILAIDVQDSLIYILSNNNNLMEQPYKKYFLIEYFYGNEYGFYSEKELDKFVQSKGYKKPVWKELYRIWEEIYSYNYPWDIKLDTMYNKRHIKTAKELDIEINKHKYAYKISFALIKTKQPEIIKQKLSIKEYDILIDNSIYKSKSIDTEADLFYYCSGNFKKFGDALRHRDLLVKMGYKDGEIVAFKNDTLIDYIEAFKYTEQKNPLLTGF